MAEPRAERLIAALAALAGAAGILIQLQIQSAEAGSLGGGLWQLARYFTYWTNTAVLVVMAATALSPRAALPGPRTRLVATASIVLVGAVYYALIYNPDATYALAQKIAEHLLHGVVPVAAVLVFLLRPHGRLGWRDIGWGVLPAVVYGAYLLARGAVDGTYPYWFTNVPKLGLVGSLKSGAMLLCAFAGATIVFIALDKALAAVLRPRAAHL